MDRIDQIIEDVKKSGDEALVKYTKEFDGIKLSKAEIEVKKDERKKISAKTDPRIYEILKQAGSNIRRHSQQKIKDTLSEKDGIRISDRYIPLNRVGIYVPGGNYPYPSTVLMCAVIARSAGVGEVIMATPPGNLSPAVASAADIAGVDRIFRIGGVQAIAAMAAGTERVPKVDKIAGPGNKYVQQAKVRLSCEVGIDMVAGPSEVVIIAGVGQNPQWIARDLMAQLEHGEGTNAVLISLSERLIEEVRKLLSDEFSTEVKYIKASGMEEAVEISNGIAPEHLQIMLSEEQEEEAGKKVKNAGAVFLGPYTPACIGDYWAGPSHTLPTGGSARYSEGLNTMSFLKKVSFIKCTRKGIKKAAGKVAALAGEEGMQQHRRSVMERLQE